MNFCKFVKLLDGMWLIDAQSAEAAWGTDGQLSETAVAILRAAAVGSRPKYLSVRQIRKNLRKRGLLDHAGRITKKGLAVLEALPPARGVFSSAE
jgi:hypothetical protein